ncbi:MAG: nicotinate-nucleotide--dimethylbenzimidazole phosphoribosyltransferase [Gammaproteobacteria bacterium]|nr:MAG: nicotinate-nucleotide--dimethylbenzimidazole phosphoribosyltransferase [Gammaproteobacteria bacterium]
MDWWLEAVPEPSEPGRVAALERQGQLTKPPGSLGRLEELAVQIAAWQGCDNPQLERIGIRVFAADHGVVAEGVSAFPQSVTVEMIRNFARGGAAIAVLARRFQASFSVINVGTVEPGPELVGVVNVQLAPGTANFCSAPAMSGDQVRQALASGAEQLPSDCDIFIGGEMGIGNTTAAAALTSALLDLPVEASVGRGTGVDDRGLALKCDAVQRALALHSAHCDSALETLRRLGGLEIAALTGAYIAAAQRGVPVLVDGYICTAAALLACCLNARVRDWMLFAHCSAEPGHRYLLEALSAEPLLDLGLHLGEGSGAAVALPLLQMACHLHNTMATFSEAGVSGNEAS